MLLLVMYIFTQLTEGSVQMFHEHLLRVVNAFTCDVHIYTVDRGFCTNVP
jgi:hypothetical protein